MKTKIKITNRFTTQSREYIILLLLLSIKISLFANSQEVEQKIDSIILSAENFQKVNNNDSACSFYLRALDLSQQVDYIKGIVNSRIGIANCEFTKGNFQTVLDITHESLEMLNKKRILNASWFSILYYLKGASEYKIRQFEASISSFQSGIAFYRNDIKPDSIYTLLSKTLGNTYFSLGNFDMAKSAYEKALEVELSMSDTSLFAASLIMNLGIIYSQKGSYSKGEEYFNKSLKIKERKTPEIKKNFTNVYLNLGRVQTIIGKIDEALVNFNKAEINYLDKYGLDSEYLIPIYLNKGGLYIIKGDLEKALTYHEKALELATRYNPSNDPIFSKLYGNLGVLNNNLGNYENAIEWLKLVNNNNNGITTEAIRNHRIMAACYKNLGNLEKARNYYLSAIKLAKQDKEKFNQDLQFCYLDFGRFYDKTGDFDNAEVYIDKALNLIGKNFGKTSKTYASCLTTKGSHLDTIGNYRDALNYYQQALIIYTEDFQNSDIYTNPKIEQITPNYNLLNTLFNKAKTQYSLYNKQSIDIKDLLASFEVNKLAISVFENLRTSFTAENSKLYTTKEYNGLYKLAIEISLKLAEITKETNYINEALLFSEKDKSAVLLSTIKESNALSFGGVPQGIINIENKLKNNIAIYSNLIYDENQKPNKNEENLSIWRDHLIIQNRKYDSLITLFESKYPKYFQLKYSKSIISVAGVQSILSNDEVLIEYEILDTTLIIFTISNSDISYTKVKINDSFIVEVKDYIEITHKYPKVENAYENFKHFAYLSNNLFNTILKPVYSKIKDKKSIIIVPDQILGYVSFESLVEKPTLPGSPKYNKLDYLINKFNIRYSYSASLLKKPKKIVRKNIRILAIAPTYSEDYIIPTTDNIGLILTPLDFAKEEVENIQNYYPCEILLGEDATESRFKKVAGEFNILHFSMHTIINNDEPLASKLVFTLNKDSINDGFLNTYEIYNMPLMADLAILSSCETGGGKLSKGEGILSLARGFIYSGVASIIMTLWEIDDVSSADIITRFYMNLKDGEKVDEALRNAKINYLANVNQLHAHPYFWSAYVQIGDNSPIIANSFRYNTIYVISIGLIILLTIIILKKRKSKQRDY